MGAYISMVSTNSTYSYSLYVYTNLKTGLKSQFSEAKTEYHTKIYEYICRCILSCSKPGLGSYAKHSPMGLATCDWP